MFIIGDAIAFASVCVVIITAIVRFSPRTNKDDADSVKEKECLLRTKNVCNSLAILKENVNELFTQFNDLNKYLRKEKKL